VNQIKGEEGSPPTVTYMSGPIPVSSIGSTTSSGDIEEDAYRLWSDSDVGPLGCHIIPYAQVRRGSKFIKKYSYVYR
jgi:hypothetical protein